MSRRSPTGAPWREVSARGGEPTDTDLLRGHLQGDPDAFCALFRRHREGLWAVAIRLLSDVGWAADAIEDAMILASRNRPEFGGADAISTWLYRIVVNVCLDRMRRSPPPPIDGDVMAALRHLFVEQQSALVLVDMLGFSVADACDILGVSADTLLSRRDRGRARLVAELSRCGRGCHGVTDNNGEVIELEQPGGVMSFTGVDSLDTSISKSNSWLADIDGAFGTKDRRLAYRVLRAWLHSLRDGLSVDMAANFAAQLPELLRGVFFDGWNPSRVPHKYDRNEFIARFGREAQVRDSDVTKSARVVTGVARKHMSEGGIAHAIDHLPAAVREILEPELAGSAAGQRRA